MNFASKTMRTVEMVITPELAKQMLATSIGNRKMRGWHVDMLANAQKRGEWKLTHQGAAFDRNGALKDGHHRLTACVQSGVTIRMMVSLGVPPESFDAVDQGVLRNLSDLSGWDKRVSEAVRLATVIVRGSRPTLPQIQEIAEGGIKDVIANLIEYCGTVRRYYSSAPMRLAASITVMNGGDQEFVFGQYRALCLLDFDAMTDCSKSLVRQVDSKKRSAGNSRDTIATGLRVFDIDRRYLSKIQVSEADIVSAVAMAREVLLQSVGEGFMSTSRRAPSRLRAEVAPAAAATDEDFL